ncbi:hypothetical protein AJ79_06820 [Helicocarpus griseus UAMH5409]|uniref:Uncharacterized protein n=1 Tax=Helicocarpus griseus UAMH5409 TaxID=1447875 RepID=A0A2B7X999_9EURO|nr:hypothetical protein AJ79_06820 [Helicocarpus griseus UAMH5409]
MGSTTVDPALSERNGLISEKAAAIGVKEIAGSDQDDANSVGAGGASDVVLLLQRQVTDLAEKIKEMELLLKERDVDKRTTNTEDESKTDTDDKPTEEEPAKEEDSKGVESKEEEEVEVKFGSIAGVKLIPYNANLTTYQIVTAEDSNKSHAIVAMYETPASRKPSMEISQAEVLDTGLLPIRIAINSSHIISRLKSVSGTSLCDEPCM